jgi:ferritin-like metal-binding protein YciE
MATYLENYHDWLLDAHAMEKQAESMLKKWLSVSIIQSYALVFRTILEKEQAITDWMRDHLPQVTQQFLERSAAPGTEAKK